MLHLFYFHCSVEKNLLFRKLIASDVEIASPVVHKLTQFMHKLMQKIDDFKKKCYDHVYLWAFAVLLELV